ncbi:efflux RND transporter periplasmic adaptor subunit [candidate division KSB1 bacterium]
MVKAIKFLTGSKRRIFTLTVIVFAALILGYIGYGSTTPDIASFTAEQGEFIIDINTSGELQAHKSESVSAPRGRRRWRGGQQIISIAPEGSSVKEGDFVLQFDTSELESELENKLDELSNAQADLKSLNANQAATMAQLKASYETQTYSHELQQINLEKMKYEAEVKQEEAKLNLKKADIALEQAKQNIESQKIKDVADLKKAEMAIRHIELEIEKIREQVEDSKIIAPSDGLVVYEKIWGPSGQQKIKVGDSPWSGQALVTLPDMSTMQVKTQVNEVDISKVRMGQEVIISCDALPDLTYYGTITEVANLARSMNRTTESNVKVFDVVVTIKNTDTNLKPGMTSTNQVITDRIDSVVYVPLTSVFEMDGKTVVYVLDPAPKEREVVVGEKNSDFIVILEGLEPGEKVTLRDPTLPLEELGGSVKEKPAGRQNRRSTTTGNGNVMIRMH